ncbi:MULTISPECIES: phosphohistidine phosphatase SixA [unclassified Chamaesiphon]|uniref:phosphohistidine phosphatase SixA n=1 Tax=unclassified Chamaesiphon TaxID=2620921 RepID=UPI00286CC25A|nr:MULTISPECIES: phosphohistidine phosphatase SixA [unclassified Chamaesiphon]
MYLYLIRHGIAEDLDPADSIANDELRCLTKAGRKRVEQVADRAIELDLKFDLIITSPLVRARQTAEISIDKKLSPKLEVSPELKPSGNLPAWLREWDARTDNITNLALVGHEPNLSEWAELLIFGKVCHQLILKKGGIIGLKFAENRIAIGTAQLFCLLPPKYLI